MLRIGVVCSIVLLGVADHLHAQDGTRPAQSREHRFVGRFVRVTTDTGNQTSGLLAAIDRSTVRIDGRNPKSINRPNVVRLEVRGDSLRNGALIGAIVALVTSPLALQGYDSTRQWARDLPLAIAAYATAGAGIDALNEGWTDVPLSSSSPRSSVSLSLYPAGRGVRVALLF
jgi:hypothetical protein